MTIKKESIVIAIASGKGGTGKTTIAVNLAETLSRAAGQTVRLLDCDVEEPNDYLFIKPEFDHEKAVTVDRPVWHEDLCTGCGACVEACRYHALALVKDSVLLFSDLCHSCGVCSHVCPVNAFHEEPDEIGTLQWTDSGDFFFAHGLLNIGEALSPKVINSVKAHIDPAAINIIDAPPGTSCPVVEAFSDVDVALLVTEPTPFGLHDLELAVGLTKVKGIPAGIVVNRSDGSDDIIQQYSERCGVPIIGRIPFKREYAEAYSDGKILARAFPEFQENMLSIFSQLMNLKDTQPDPHVSVQTQQSLEKAELDVKTGHAEDFEEWTIISGKGGTGKTTLSLAFARLAEHQVLADADVDAANLHLLLNPKIIECHDFSGGVGAEIRAEACISCGQCAEKCHFQAIDAGSESYVVDPLKCEGCGLCALVCPEKAIDLKDVVNGQLFVSETECGPMVHAELGIAEENSGRLVADVRKRAAELAHQFKIGRIQTDGPPGTGCPVIASISGTSHVLIVTEPTVSGVHDLKRVLKLTRHFNLPASVIINKYDINPAQADRIADMALEYDSKVIGRIPFDPLINQALIEGKNPIDYQKGPAYEAICQCWGSLNH